MIPPKSIPQIADEYGAPHKTFYNKLKKNEFLRENLDQGLQLNDTFLTEVKQSALEPNGVFKTDRDLKPFTEESTYKVKVTAPGFETIEAEQTAMVSDERKSSVHLKRGPLCIKPKKTDKTHSFYRFFGFYTEGSL